MYLTLTKIRHHFPQELLARGVLSRTTLENTPIRPRIEAYTCRYDLIAVTLQKLIHIDNNNVILIYTSYSWLYDMYFRFIVMALTTKMLF